MLLRDAILRWDKKSRRDIEAVFDDFHDCRDFVENLIGLLGISEAQCGATWLIKHHLDEGGKMPDEQQTAAILDQAPQMAEWTSRLHVLQAVHLLTIPGYIAEGARAFFLSQIEDENKFIRAWAYSALGHLACQHSQYREESFLLIHKALDKEVAGSIRSRLNKALKNLEKF